MDIDIRLDTSKLKSDVMEVLNEKVKSIPDSFDYVEILEILHKYIISLPNMPEDTGALKGIGGGIPSTGRYERTPNLRINRNGIYTNPVEHQPAGDRHYGYYALSRIYGEDVANGIIEELESSGELSAFCKEIAPIIVRYMNNG